MAALLLAEADHFQETRAVFDRSGGRFSRNLDVFTFSVLSVFESGRPRSLVARGFDVERRAEAAQRDVGIGAPPSFLLRSRAFLATPR